jgi:hypothetical protein
MVHKHRNTSMINLQKAGETPLKTPVAQQQPPPPPPPPFVDQTPEEERLDSSQYWFGNRGSLHAATDEHESFHFTNPTPPGESEQSFLMGNSTRYDSISGRRQVFGPDVEQGYPRMYHYGEGSRSE